MGKTFVYNTGNAKPPVDELHLEIGVFFDGTLNSLKNTELRQKYRDGKNKIESTDSDDIIKKKEEDIKETRKQQEKEYYKLKNKDISENDSERDQYLKASHRQPMQPWRLRFGMDRFGVDDSFSNDYTNVARMYLCSLRETYGIYIEGIGTLDNNRDVDDGFQYGSGKTGVRGKVRLGCEKLAERIKKMLTQSSSEKDSIKIKVDTFGFSRGAAAARNFTYEINGNKRPEDIDIKKSKKIIGYEYVESYAHEAGQIRVPVYGDIWIDKDKTEVDPQYLVNGKLPKYGFLGYYLLSKGVLSKEELENLEIKVRFIGVYDTVSSYEEFGDMGAGKRVAVKGTIHSARGPSHYFGNDVEQLQLNNLGSYKKVVHFTAMDEHRENFSLTRLPASNAKFPITIEKEFPGVHCDIGGAYENATEEVDEIETSNHKPLWFLAKRRKQLIQEYWFNDDQIEINNQFWNIATLGTVYRKITGKRFLRKEYSYIPLHFMEEHGEKIYDHQLMTKTETSYSIENDPYLPSAKKHLYHYIFDDGRKWIFKTDDEIAREKEEKALQKQLKLETKIPEMQKAEIDNVYVKKPVEIPILLPKPEDKTTYEEGVDENGEKIRIGTIEEVIITPIADQDLLRIMRNKYLHWSANRDWLGMDPNNDYQRRYY